MNAVPRPPRLAQFLVEWCAPRPVREHLLGDLNEQFLANASTFSIKAARRRYWRQAMATLWHWPLGPGPEPQPHVKNRESSMFSLLDDARFAVRQLLRQPSYLAIAVLSLALAIAANGLVFGLVNNLILNPFNYPDSKRLVSIGGAFPTLGGERNFVEQFSPPEVMDFVTIPVIEKLGAFDLGNAPVRLEGAERSLPIAYSLRLSCGIHCRRWVNRWRWAAPSQQRNWRLADPRSP